MSKKTIEALQAEVDRLRAERDYWRENAGLHQIASAAYKAKLEPAPVYRIEPLDIDQLIAEQDEENSRGGI